MFPHQSFPPITLTYLEFIMKFHDVFSHILRFFLECPSSFSLSRRNLSAVFSQSIFRFLERL